MIFALIALIIVCLYKVEIFQRNSFCTEYLSKENTMSVKGLFMCFIIARHYKSYVELNGVYDQGFVLLNRYLGQAIVVVFLFYSGYGIYESIKRKGSSYIHAMPYKRIFITLINFDIAIALFWLVDCLLQKEYSVRTILLAFTGWTSIGNSNWYIFAVLICYIITWFSFLLLRKHPFAAITAVTVLSAVYMLVVHEMRPKEDWWYNTVFCYAAGMWYSYFKTQIENFIFKQYRVYYLLLLISVLGVVICRPYRDYLPAYELWSLAFTAMVILLTMKISIHNDILGWIGKYTFEIYILQRIPMIILTHFHINQYPYVFGLLSLGITFLLAFFFRRLLNFADGKLLSIWEAAAVRGQSDT